MRNPDKADTFLEIASSYGLLRCVGWLQRPVQRPVQRGGLQRNIVCWQGRAAAAAPASPNRALRSPSCSPPLNSVSCLHCACSKDELGRLSVVECDLEQPETIAPAIGAAARVRRRRHPNLRLVHAVALPARQRCAPRTLLTPEFSAPPVQPPLRPQVVCAVGAAESELGDVSAPRRIDGEGATRLVEAANAAGVEQFVLVTSLGTGKLGFPAGAPHRG